jgi:hypothetical protein
MEYSITPKPFENVLIIGKYGVKTHRSPERTETVCQILNNIRNDRKIDSIIVYTNNDYEKHPYGQNVKLFTKRDLDDKHLCEQLNENKNKEIVVVIDNIFYDINYNDGRLKSCQNYNATFIITIDDHIRQVNNDEFLHYQYVLYQRYNYRVEYSFFHEIRNNYINNDKIDSLITYEEDYYLLVHNQKEHKLLKYNPKAQPYGDIELQTSDHKKIIKDLLKEAEEIEKIEVSLRIEI